MMKKLICTILAALMALGTFAQGGIFTVKGTFDWKKDSVNFVITSAKQNSVVPPIKKKRAITGEMIEVSFNLKEASMLYVIFSENGRQSRLKKIPAVPGETLELYRDENNVTRKRGSQFYVDYDEAEQCIEAPLTRITDLMTEMYKGFTMETTAEEMQKVYEEKYAASYEANYDEFKDALMDYVKAHPDRDASAAIIATIAIANSDTQTEDIEAAAALLTERARQSSAAGLYKFILEPAKKKRAEQERRSALVGEMAPDFTLMDINGNPLTLSSLRGKWVIIDFWGSWCGWCIKGMPQMMEYYAKYQDKLEILGVDCYDTDEKWKDAVAKNELPWLHVYCDDKKGDNPMKLYLVKSFPTKVVVDPEGKVAKILSGEDPAFYDFLDEVLK